MSSDLPTQIEEVQLLQSSLTKDEFKWLGSPDEVQAWQAQLTSGAPASDSSSPMSFSIRLQERQPTVWFDVSYSRVAGRDPSIRVYAVDDANAADAEADTEALSRLNDLAKTQLDEAKAQEITHRVFDVYTVLQAHLADHPVQPTGGGRRGSTAGNATATPTGSPSPSRSQSSSPSSPSRRTRNRTRRQTRTVSRTIIWSHHLIAPSKRRDLSAWAAELNLWILLKIGYPGYLCFEGFSSDVQEIVRRVKGLQWHAISVRSEESWDVDQEAGGSDERQSNEQVLLQCGLAQGHSAKQTVGSTTKLRTGCDEVETIKEIMDR